MDEGYYVPWIFYDRILLLALRIKKSLNRLGNRNVFYLNPLKLEGISPEDRDRPASTLRLLAFLLAIRSRSSGEMPHSRILREHFSKKFLVLLLKLYKETIICRLFVSKRKIVHFWLKKRRNLDYHPYEVQYKILPQFMFLEQSCFGPFFGHGCDEPGRL
jgi:hypothetical protein